MSDDSDPPIVFWPLAFSAAFFGVGLAMVVFELIRRAFE